MKAGFVIVAALVIMTAASLGIIQSVMAKKGDSGSYDAGHEHGCSDSEKPIGDRYIDKPEKGQAFHSDVFNNGYNAGVRDCMG
jgi:hypothetical protein